MDANEIRGIIRGEVKDILEVVNFLKDNILTKDEGVTKEDFEEFRKENREEHHEMNRRLDVLEEKMDNLSGLPKEIDHVIGRVGRLERSAGLADVVV